VAVTIALLAALTYGAADFLGGIASRRSPASVVVVFSQLAGIAVFLVSLAFVPSRFQQSDLVWGALAGLGGAVGIAALYAALAVGRMGVISPLTAVIGASVPVAVGLALGERPSAAALAGIALAFVAVVLVSADPRTLRLSFEEPGLMLAVVSGLGIGLSLVALSRSSSDSGIAALAPARVVSVALLLLWARGRRESLRVPRGDAQRFAGGGRGHHVAVSGVDRVSRAHLLARALSRAAVGRRRVCDRGRRPYHALKRNRTPSSRKRPARFSLRRRSRR
jgi:drug/metabolite transporter (DMT)-like permease